MPTLISTRRGVRATPLAAVLQGLAPDGGLYVPERIPVFGQNAIERLCHAPYPELAAEVVGTYFEEIPHGQMLRMCEEAYTPFSSDDVVPVADIDGNTFALQLFYGPTLAFKDVALQLLPLLMAYGAKETALARKVLILVATSGDTGKAALCGFADKPDTAICVFYPELGVSSAQKLQMQTQRGKNVGVFAVQGNFDDCQRGVKTLMGDAGFLEALGRRGYVLSSANSINFGRLVPQVAYYFSAYAQLCRRGAIRFGEKVNFAVPTGNFGDILAGYMAKRMGLPVDKLIGASNRNNVLDIFFSTGVYRADLSLVPTTSPSMDILVSSNLERLLFSLSGNDGNRVEQWMRLQREGKDFVIDSEMQTKLREDFLWGWADETAVNAAIRETFAEYRVLLDPHSAVGMDVVRKLQRSGAIRGKTVLLCTASPFKFASDVRFALSGTKSDARGDVYALAEIAGIEPPKGITELFDAEVLHDRSLKNGDMKEAVLGCIDTM